MKISLKWIQEFVNIEDYMSRSPELAEILTQAGFEVEAIQDSRHQFHHVVVGHILEKEKHPNADKLSVCRVSTGQNQVHQIVCGAQNHKTGDRVVVALPGAVLPGNFAIKKSTLRGVESGGMLCSFRELNLQGPDQGIAILESDAPVGKSFAEFWGLDDVIFELKVTPNRADGLSHFGLAREIGALLQRPVKDPTPQLAGTRGPQTGPVKVDIKAPELAPRYMARYISNVRVEPSPEWIQKRLESVGLKSINNVVDVTNLILMEFGQPLHAFDADQITGGKLIVDRATSGEKFKTLDGKDLNLTSDQLTIRDGSRALCLAGVMGGLNSGTTVDTQNVLLEAAYFLPETVRKTSRQLGLNSDSSYRFSRGIDSDFTERALARACELIQELTGGQVAKEYVDFDSRQPESRQIHVCPVRVSERLGYAASREKLREFALRLHFQIEKDQEGQDLVLIPPRFRHDIFHEMDFVEEYARLDGYEKIPETLPAFLKNPDRHDRNYVQLKKLSEKMVGMGFSQALNFAFVSQVQESKFLGPRSGETIPLVNPLNEEMNVMRSSLTFGLWNNVLHNYRHGQESGALFETGKVFFRDKSQIQEGFRFSALLWGHAKSWSSTSELSPVYKLKSVLETISKDFRWNSCQVKTGAPGSSPAFLHQGQWGEIEFQGRPIGWMGTFHPGLLNEHKIRVPVAVLELEMEPLLKVSRGAEKVKTPSKFPTVERDLALVMPSELPVGDLLRSLRRHSGELLVHVKVLDVFTGEPLEKGKKSVAVRVAWQDSQATLQDDKVNALQQKLLQGLQSQYPVALR